ncbi:MULTISPECIES: hypothetical protein [Actinokineospora]|uniref:Uncharacterized protein n=1 Tax=Actinokineospora fastidiosa TaxID=1816 RepID=A0A918G918_9PSEU|nr:MULTISPECIES: hypothetical protein [Actinokineospora]UVS82067.1 hypothetical protein Actkin_05832 [Actinokineospora sp. UTMC 2448]GGS23745.1 hypothetical protein GCM10010171_16080 [Actinokineospora fastidiosa]
MGLIALIVVVVALVVTLGHAAYLGLLNAAAKKKGAAGSQVARDVRARLPVAGATAAGALLAGLISSGSGFADVLAILLAAGSAAIAGSAQVAAQQRYQIGR